MIDIKRVILANSAVLSIVFAVVAANLETETPLIWHVPAAVLSYFFFIVCVVVNIARALRRSWPFKFAKIACELGLICAGVTIVSGMIWGKQAWGVAWVWEPRLTGMFLTTLMFASWRLSSHIIEKNVAASRYSTSALIVLALPAIAFTHVATKLFGGIHPDAMPASGGSDSLEGIVWTTLCYVAFCIFFALFRFLCGVTKEKTVK